MDKNQFQHHTDGALNFRVEPRLCCNGALHFADPDELHFA
jgi:hypothetical protein